VGVPRDRPPGGRRVHPPDRAAGGLLGLRRLRGGPGTAGGGADAGAHARTDPDGDTTAGDAAAVLPQLSIGTLPGGVDPRIAGGVLGLLLLVLIAAVRRRRR
jgi:hypothetical protein